ncbi:MAG: cation transport regulator ChaB [Candidatus Midichloriaceae bacterium]|jgi:cation transport regulator|nr:cation transport regulator ChaB [Candidatus Midichloriaceae bacterium]
MPYRTNSDLPSSVTSHLPEHAQDIYRSAFNSAWAEYKDIDGRKGGQSREQVAHKVAWAAVKKKYHKEGDQWVEK